MNFKQHFVIIYNKFIKHAATHNLEAHSKAALGRFLDIGHGRIQAWEKGQWPSAADLAIIEQKLGFSLRWLVTGEGEPEGKEEIAGACAQESHEEIEALRSENIRLTQELNSTLKELSEAHKEIIAWQREAFTLRKEENEKNMQNVTGTSARGARIPLHSNNI